MSEYDGWIEMRVDDQASPVLYKMWLEMALTDDYMGSALAHEGIEPPDDVVQRIAGDIRARFMQVRFGPGITRP